MEGQHTHGMTEGEHQKHKHNTFWINGQVSFTFMLHGNPPNQRNMRSALHLDQLDAFLRTNRFILDLPKDPKEEIPDIYLFPDPENTGSDEVLVVTFFRFTEIGLPEIRVQQHDPTNHMGAQTPPLNQTPVARLVNLVNAAIEKRDSGGTKVGIVSQQHESGPLPPDIPITSAAPHWLCGASNHITTGCPLIPPIPVPPDKRCSSTHGLWPFSLPDIPYELKGVPGDDVTVFVMDTLPPEGHIKRAAQAAGSHNLLLLDLIDNVKFSYPSLLEEVDHPNELQAGTGKDIEGEFMSFHMPDHGLFVAGIIRDLAPDAHVECIRILSDLGAGATKDLIKQLQHIRERKAKGRDLHNKDVVVNLSLVTPSDEDVDGSDIDLGKARQGLLGAIQSLTSRGVVFAIAAGNEGDPRNLEKGKPRPDALYPAAFAYPNTYNGITYKGIDNIVPVGAVKRNQHAASYSCYPGEKGVATYGGELPHVYEDSGTKKVHIDDIDAPIGVYTQLFYPAPSSHDPEATYPAPDAHGWAYWIGTSFATPIVAAVAARAFELKRIYGSAMLIRDYITTQAATASTLWTYKGGTAEGHTIRAVQCRHTFG
ncbi:MAG TPA: S8 family serine peptidase [Ktedonobacteraceae bacterium]|nr:S8 family serine peptidase [Ktedonobacteraceae bacterium]